MAELKYYLESPDTGTVYGPMSATDRSNGRARGYKDVTDEHTNDGGSETGSNRQPPSRRQTARTVPSQQPAQTEPAQTPQG